ncbi:hypothetical protein GTA51_07655 [Desulfovibrio aerotolerans]|uniref:Uncharacterized protein n=1 Tax=Solidesulfovibrio aerotolerans TaxID=295255 RepID=A0A7C9MEX5_9BACT|nr:hypothetical protein [Solidesulfovibrio aerotolerans]MYL83010.1 hypothetical protein [Solidesulfovibrio aerotolerans]
MGSSEGVAPGDRAKLTCWALYANVQGRKLSALSDQALREPGREISYKHQGKNFFVLSGTRDGKIFYHKTLMEHGIQASFELSYASHLTLFWSIWPVHAASIRHSHRVWNK